MQKNKVGILLNNLQPSQISYYAVGTINGLLRKGFDAIVFVKNLCVPSTRPFCSIMNQCEAIDFDGLLIATDLDSAEFLLNINTECKKVFYVWDLEWLRGANNFLKNMEVYRSQKLKIVVRSEQHEKIFTNYTNRKPDAVIPDLNMLGVYNEFCE